MIRTLFFRSTQGSQRIATTMFSTSACTNEKKYIDLQCSLTGAIKRIYLDSEKQAESSSEKIEIQCSLTGLFKSIDPNRIKPVSYPSDELNETQNVTEKKSR